MFVAWEVGCMWYMATCEGVKNLIMAPLFWLSKIPKSAILFLSPQFVIMPVTRNLRVHNTHNASTGHLLLHCSFERCQCQFKSRTTLTRHQRTSHLPDAGCPHSDASLPPDEPNGDRYSCTFVGCLHSFNNKGVLTQNSRLQHISHPAPVTAPLSPFRAPNTSGTIHRITSSTQDATFLPRSQWSNGLWSDGLPVQQWWFFATGIRWITTQWYAFAF